MAAARALTKGSNFLASGTMRFGSTAKVLAECMLKYYRISECPAQHLLPQRRAVISHPQALFLAPCCSDRRRRLGRHNQSSGAEAGPWEVLTLPCAVAGDIELELEEFGMEACDAQKA